MSDLEEAIKELEFAIGEQLGIFKLIEWLNNLLLKIKGVDKMKIDKYLEIQKMVSELYEDDLVGISEDYIHLTVDRFLEEFDGEVDDYSWVKDPESVANGEYHLSYYYKGTEFVAVFNDYNFDDLYEKVENSEFKNDLMDIFGDLNEEN